MKLYTYSAARQQLSKVLDTANREGKVLIRRRDGSLFALIPERRSSSPFDIEGVSTNVTTPEIVAVLRKERRKNYKGTGQ